MAPQPLPRSEVERAAVLYKQALIDGASAKGVPICSGRKSALTWIVEHSDWSANQAGTRLKEAERLGMLGGAPDRCDYAAPDLPEPDENLDALISRMEAEQARQTAYRQAAEWMRFEVRGDEPFALAFVGDPHIDTCDIARLRAHVELIEATPRMWAVGLGDWLNGWTGKLRGEYAHQAVTERQAYQLARWLLQRPIWWLLLLGNHDGQRWHGQGSPLRWMETAAPVPALDWQAKFSVACGAASWRVWAAHNFPGHSQFNATHGVDKRALFTGAVADLFVAGDRHTFKLSQDQHEHTGRIYWSARARGYKPLDMYALERGHGEQGGALGTGHSIGAVFDPRDGSLICFSELHKAAAYLGSLRHGRR